MSVRAKADVVDFPREVASTYCALVRAPDSGRAPRRLNAWIDRGTPHTGTKTADQIPHAPQKRISDAGAAREDQKYSSSARSRVALVLPPVKDFTTSPPTKIWMVGKPSTPYFTGVSVFVFVSSL